MAHPARLEPLGQDEKPPYAYCESVHATGTSPWHIRKVTDKGLKFGGGIDTSSLCEDVKSGWDLQVRMSETHDGHTCPKCLPIYRKLKGC
jgi:hypothetical protein